MFPILWDKIWAMPRCFWGLSCMEVSTTQNYFWNTQSWNNNLVLTLYQKPRLLWFWNSHGDSQTFKLVFQPPKPMKLLKKCIAQELPLQNLCSACLHIMRTNQFNVCWDLRDHVRNNKKFLLEIITSNETGFIATIRNEAATNSLEKKNQQKTCPIKIQM